VKDDAIDRENRKHDGRVHFLASLVVKKVMRVVRKSTSFRVSSKRYSFAYSISNLLDCL